MKRKIILSLLLILLLGIFAYNNALNGKFVLDDYFLVRNNAYIREVSNLPKFFASNIAEGSSINWGFYRPIQMATYLTDYAFWKLDVFGYHLTNVLLHVLAAFFVFWLTRILFTDLFLSWFTAALFTLSPIHTEAVTYISGRADSLVTIFLLLGLILYINPSTTLRIDTERSECIKAIKSGKWMFIYSLISFMLALLSRENALIFPILILLYHWTFKKKIIWARMAVILAIGILYILLRQSFLNFRFFMPIPFPRRVPGFFIAFTNYLRLLICPADLHMEYGKKIFKFANPRVITGIVLFLLFCFAAFKSKKSSKLAFFSLTWFLLTLLPQANLLYTLNAFMAEHWLYLPSIGFFLLLAGAINYFYKNKELKVFAVVVSVTILALYANATMRQNVCWQEPVSFYKQILKYSPENERIMLFLGNTYGEQSKFDDAEAIYKEAIKIHPQNPDTYFNLGSVYLRSGKIEEAKSSYAKALEINPDHPYARYNLEALNKIPADLGGKLDE